MRFGFNMTYNIDGFLIKLSNNHRLPKYQRLFPMYDRFVPYLGELADIHRKRCVDDSNRGVIIDIGANVGDTLAAIIKHTEDNIICIEPVPQYYRLLVDNIASMGNEYRDRVTTSNIFVGSNDVDNHVYECKYGTAHMVETDHKSDISTLSLETIISCNDVCPKKLDIIKVDTDGFDAQCIMSIGELLKDIDPLIFWENMIEDDSQYNSYCELALFLDENGYTDFYIFDNFGNLLIKTDTCGLKSVNDYLVRIRHKHSGRSFYYVDVLAIKNNCQAYQDVIDSYLSTFR
ncbi:MAG: FkbM family methyltransferase [Lachnospiraceae bacterium]|nr:FkbM family methyltransferase [Lachnospiraceae bacterium]